MPDEAKTCPTCGGQLGGRWRNRCYRCKGRPRTGEVRRCPVCGKDFHAPQWKLDDTARNQGAYCSRECKHRAQMLPPMTYPTVPIVDGTLRCGSCGSVKAVDEFGDDKRKLNGKKSWCRSCSSASVTRWRERYPDRYEAMKKLPKTELQRLRRRDREMLQTYGITLLKYEQMLAEQGGTCRICGEPPGSRPGRSGRSLHVDHDHACCPGAGSCGNCIRGLLCGNCNTLLGLARDSADVLMRAAQYLAGRARAD